MAQRTPPGSPRATALLDRNLRQLHHAFRWAIHTRLFADLCTHGNTRWVAVELVWLTLVWVWSECTTLTGAFAQACQLTRQLLGRVAVQSYPGFTNALTRWTPVLVPRLWDRLHQRMAAIAGPFWRIGPWLPLAVDGSRTTTPRTQPNERAFNRPRLGRGCTAKSRRKWKNKRRRQKKLTAVHPQIWLTLLWHIGLRMPWAWKCGPSYASERAHVTELLATGQFPENTLFCGDAGFVGYDLWRAMADRGHHFLIRVGSNVRLLRRLGDVKRRGEFVYCWPKAAAAKGQPPLRLRLLKFRTGRCVVYAVTNVLAEADLSREQAQSLYAKRWGVEVQFRSLKQTFGRGKLHSRTPERALVELEWSLVGLWLIQLVTAAEQIPAGVGPERSSVSVAVQVFREAMRLGLSRSLREQLREAVTDAYQRRGSKRGRHRPNYKDRPSARRPVIVNANAQQRLQYQLLQRPT